MPGGIGGALGGGIFGVPGAVGGALGGAGLDWLVVKPLSIAADLASTALHKLAEGVHFLVEKVFTLGIEFEKTRTEFSIMAGSPEKGLNLLGRIQELAVKSPYTTRELAPTGRMLLSMGVDPEDVPSVLSRIGDVAGGSRDRLNRLTLAYGQVVAAGRFRATELRQFTEAGVGVSDFARAAGVSPRRLREMMEGGEAGADIVGRTFNQITGPGGRFFNMSAGVNRTVGGQLNTLQESLEIAGQKAGVSAFARYDVSGRIDRLTASIEDIIKAAEKGGPALDEVVKMLDSVYEGVQKSIGSSNLTWESLTSTLADFGKNDLPGLITGIIELSGAFMELTAFSLRAAREIAAVVLAVPDTVSWAYHGFNSNTTGTYQKSREAFVNSTTALADAASRGGGFLLDRGQGVGDRVATAYALGGMRGAGLPEPEPGQMVNGRWLPHSTVTLAGGRTVSALSPEGRAALLSAGIPITYGYSAGGQQQLTRALQPFGVAGGQVPFLQNFFGAFGAVPRQGFVSPNIPIAPNAPRWSGEDQQLIDAMKKKFLERDPVTTLLNQFSLASRLQNPLVARNFNQLLFGEGFVPGINQQQGNFAREQAMTEFKKDMGIPVSPWEQFQKSMDQINTGIGADFTSRFAQGFGGGMAGTGLTTAMAAARAAAGAQGGPLQNALRMARVGAFDKLTQVRPWDSLPTAMQLGSSQAQETINRSMMMQQVGGGVQDRIDEALQEHKEMQQKQLKKLEDIEKAIKDRPGVEVVGG
jgi:tape measure domain-containing protein